MKMNQVTHLPQLLQQVEEEVEEEEVIVWRKLPSITQKKIVGSF